MINSGITVLDSLMPNGFPRSSFILINGEGGTGKSVMLQELAYRRIEKGDNVIYICLDDSPEYIVENMKALGFDVTDMIGDRITFLDGFSFRAREYVKNSQFPIVDPNDFSGITKKINLYIDRLKMEGKGMVIFDSLTEMMTLCGAPVLLEHIKTWRVMGPKVHNVTFLASHHFGIKPLEEFSSVLDYIMDGLIDIRYDPVLMEKGILLKQVRVRKMRGVWHDTRWKSFVITSEGIKEFDKVGFEYSMVRELLDSLELKKESG